MLKRLLYHNFKTLNRFRQWRQRRMTQAGSIAILFLLGTGVFGVDTRQTLAFQIAALMLCLFGLAIPSVLLFRPKLSARRELPDYATVGQPLQYDVLLENSAQRHERGLSLADNLATPIPDFETFAHSTDSGDAGRNVFDRKVGYPRWVKLVRRARGADIKPISLPDLAAESHSKVRMQLTPLRRGYLHFTSLTLLRPDPLGLVNALRHIPIKDSLLVLPKRYELPLVQLPGKRRYQPGGIGMATGVGDSQEFNALREYRPGDPIRHIHWRSWARLGTPVVKEFQDEFFVRQALLLDTFTDTDDDPVFEEAVSVAASVVSHQADQDCLLDLMFIGTQAHHFTVGRGLSSTTEMLETLACVLPCKDKPFHHLQSLVQQHQGQLSGFICVLQGWDEQRQQLIRHLRALDLPLHVYVITDTGIRPEPGPMDDLPGQFVVLQQGRIEQQIQGLRGQTGTVPDSAADAA